MNDLTATSNGLGTEFEAEARSLSSDGSAVVAHPDGRVFFVLGAWPGDRGRFRIDSLEKRYGTASVVAITEPSVDRREAPCPHQGYTAGRCGGCTWMIGTYESQLRHKEHRVRYAFERSRLDAARVRPIRGGRELGYRNRAQFKTDGQALGYVSAQSRVLAPITSCPILNKGMTANFEALRARLPEPAWAPSAGFVWNYLDVDDDLDLARGDAVPLNRRRPFKQGNAEQNAFMREWLRGLMREIGSIGSAIELFCGGGNFTEILSEAGVRDILAVEVSADSLRELEAKALPGVRVLPSDLSKFYNYKRLPEKAPDAELLLLDPPREGAKDLTFLPPQLKKLKHVVYVSCDLATFVRDASRIERQGYALQEAQPLDLFPQTPHVEILAHFEKR